MSAVTQKKIDMVSKLRILAKLQTDLAQQFAAIRAEYTALGYSSDDLAEGCVGGNEGLTGADMVAVIVTADALAIWMASGHATNLYKVVA